MDPIDLASRLADADAMIRRSRKIANSVTVELIAKHDVPLNKLGPNLACIAAGVIGFALSTLDERQWADKLKTIVELGMENARGIINQAATITGDMRCPPTTPMQTPPRTPKQGTKSTS